MSKLKQAAAALLVLATGFGSGLGAYAVTAPAPAIKCSTARHLVQCEECQVFTTRVVLATIENANKAQAKQHPLTDAVAPVRSTS